MTNTLKYQYSDRAPIWLVRSARSFFFFLEHTGELRTIILRRIKRRKETPYNTTHSLLGKKKKLIAWRTVYNDPWPTKTVTQAAGQSGRVYPWHLQSPTNLNSSEARVKTLFRFGEAPLNAQRSQRVSSQAEAGKLAANPNLDSEFRTNRKFKKRYMHAGYIQQNHTYKFITRPSFFYIIP